MPRSGGKFSPSLQRTGGREMVFKTTGIVLICFMMATLSAADSLELDLTAGESTVSGGVHYKGYIDSGYYRFGGSGIYTDDDDTEYTIGSLDLTVGSDIMVPGLNCEVGLRGIYGTADEDDDSGDIGAVAFTGSAGYLFPSDMIPIPVEVFGAVTWAPEPLAFEDTEMYLEFKIGVGVHIMRNASIVASYTNYHIDMTSGPGDWTLDDDPFQIGLSMRF